MVNKIYHIFRKEHCSRSIEVLELRHMYVFMYVCGLFSFSIAVTANIILVVGIHYKSYVLVIPYFFVYVLFVFSIILLLFVNFLDTANSKDTLTAKSLLYNFPLIIVLTFEVYLILLVWRLFVYICDFRMDAEVKAKERSRKNEQKLKRFDRRDCVPIVVHVPSDSVMQR
ncbi:hypothetical protein RB195_002740 [Necator americanus]|uniref:Uncharacterized protein n=1 Tax=Necator americanus TaxID=51031 RepID=A0ABR1DKG0_NECAM